MNSVRLASDRMNHGDKGGIWPGIGDSAVKRRVGSHPEVVTRKPSVFATANELAELFGIISLRFEVSAVGVRSTVRTAQGLKVPVIPVAKRARPDLVVVPALGYKMPDPLIAALGRSDVIDAGHALRRWVGHGAMTAAACIGTFVVAETGLLDDRPTPSSTRPSTTTST
jgi:transcriptional regulator GlxA family with amidase domain